MRTPNCRIVAAANKNPAVIEIYDEIGPSWAGMIDAKLISRLLEQAGDVTAIDVRINSPGGGVNEAIAIHNMLKRHPATVTVYVDGVAASAASVIAMAGDVIIMPKNTRMMIHDPWTIAFGGKKEMNAAVEMLESATKVIIETYAARCKKPHAEIAQMMADETWFTGEEAVAAGFADRTEGEVTVSNSAAANELTARYRKAPQNFASLVSLAMRQPPEERSMKTADQEAAEAKAAADAKAATDAKTAAEAKVTADAKAAADAQAATAAQAAASNQAVEAERKRGADITAVCNQAGKPQLASAFITANTSVDEVQKELFKVLCKERPPVDDPTGADTSAAADPDAKLKKEYAQNKAAYAKAGVSEADFVASRKVDLGVEELKSSK